MSDSSLVENLQEASPGPYQNVRRLWQRWRNWNGSNLIISLLLHIVVFVVAALLVVQVMQPREKAKFKSTPPSPNPPAEHSVKAAKKSASMSQPTISKRITTTAANASIALPAMEMNSSMPDMMSSVMSSLGASGLGAGASAGGGLGALPPGGLTAFGFRGGKGGVVGHFYDLSQTSDKRPVANFDYGKQVKEFQDRDWDESILKKYYCAPDSMSATQLFMPCSNSSGASKAFNVEREAPNAKWVVLYKGTLIPSRDMELRFWASADDFMQIRIDGSIVLPAKNIRHDEVIKVFPDTPNPPTGGNQGFYGEWFNLRLGNPCKIEILIGDAGGLYDQILLAEERNPAKPYEMRLKEPKALRLPLVQFRRGLPMPSYDPGQTVDYNGNPRTPLPYDRNPEPASEPLILQAR